MEIVQKQDLPFDHLNIDSILPKIEQLGSLLINLHISVLRITERKLNNTANNAEVEIDGYNLIQYDRNKKGGAIGCYIKPNILFNYHGSHSENFENILIDILLPKSKPMALGLIYRLSDQSSFMDDFYVLLN